MNILFFIQILVLTAFMSTPFCGYAQTYTLYGNTSIFNSKYETGKTIWVDGVQVLSDFVKPQLSDSKGYFSLEYIGFDAGTKVKISAEKNNLEVVNDRDLMEITISRNYPLQIFLAVKGKINNSKIELYNISKEQLYAKHNELIAKLRTEGEIERKTIAYLRVKLNHTIKNRIEAEDLLNKQFEESKKRLPEFAKE